MRPPRVRIQQEMALPLSLDFHLKQPLSIKFPEFSNDQKACNFSRCFPGQSPLPLPRNRLHKRWRQQRGPWVLNCSREESGQSSPEDQEVDNVGVKAALSMLRFYKREISPLLPNSCRFVPTCSEYSMIAYKKYGVVKGTVLTAWRLCRCNPLGDSGFDPPRWFGEGRPED